MTDRPGGRAVVRRRSILSSTAEAGTVLVGKRAPVWTLLWALSPLYLGLSSSPCFAWAAWRLRSRALAVEAAVYLVLTVLWIEVADVKSKETVGAAIAVALAGVPCARAFAVRRRLLGPSLSPAGMTRATSREQAAHTRTPEFSVQAAQEVAPGLPSTLMCDGQDRHELGMPRRQAAALGIGGAAVIAVCVVLHLSGRIVGTGIGLMLVPVLAVLFARWVDGPVLYYRSWGLLHQLPLGSVTAVTAGKPTAGGRSVELHAPGRAKPLRVSLQSRRYVMSTAARQHLRGWLGGPYVQWTPDAVAVFSGDSQRTAGGRRLVVLAATIVVSLAAVGIGIWVALERNARFAIAGAPGYKTFSGPDGDPLAVGRPWGTPCQPIHFEVERGTPDWVYTEVVTVVNAARQDGINVTTENRDLGWFPNSLYYVAGQSPATAARVEIWPHYETPPQLSDGHPEHINLGWDARPTPTATTKTSRLPRLEVAPSVVELR